MSQGYVTPVAPSALSDVKLGEGNFYANYGLGNQVCLGPTRGGGGWKESTKIRDIDWDGKYGPVKGYARKTDIGYEMEVNALQINSANYIKFFAGHDVTDMTTYKKIRARINIEASDYLTNLAFVGVDLAGNAVVCIIENPLGVGEADINFKEKDEWIIKAKFVAYYDPTTITTPPGELRFIA